MAISPLDGDDDAPRPFSDINVTPLVDVMLVLLVIFMVTAPMLTAGIGVTLPRAAATPIHPPAPPLSLTLRRDGTIFLDREAVTAEALGGRLADLHAAAPDRALHLRGDRDLDYGAIMRVMGVVQRAGITRVALLADPATE